MPFADAEQVRLSIFKGNLLTDVLRDILSTVIDFTNKRSKSILKLQ